MESANDFAKAYGSVLMKTATTWVFNCDSGCFADVCTREAWTHGPYLCIYQPHKSMAEYDDMYATCFIKRLDKKPVSKAELAGHAIAEAHLMDSFGDYVRASGGRWTHPIDGSFKQLVQIQEALRLEKGTARFTFEIRGAVDGCCGDSWFPHRLDDFLRDREPNAAGAINEDGTLVDPEFGEKLSKPVTMPK